MKTAAVIRHVHFEDLGTFEEPLRAGYEFQYYDVPAATGLLIPFGAPLAFARKKPNDGWGCGHRKEEEAAS
ncbi:MAG: hypothetical protein WBV25_11810 [Methylocella sp.]